jgi:hypothetical protein
MRSHVIDDDENWLFLGDFNFYRSLEDRNKPGGNLSDTLIFNDLLGHLGLLELPLKGRAFTWSNMQQDPLLEQLDWFFTSANWTVHYPNTLVLPLAKITSDHIPCKITIGTDIPKANIFRFENFWPEHPGFIEAVVSAWDEPVRNSNSSASVLAGKLKNTRFKLKNWSKSLSQLSSLIKNCNKVIFFLDSLEECRQLLLTEWNLRLTIKRQLQMLLRYKNLYWRKRFTVNRIRFGDECTKFFHAMATVSHRKNSITYLRDDTGNQVHDHEGKAALLLQEYKNRLGISLQPDMLFDLSQLVSITLDLESLVAPFLQQEIDNIINLVPIDKAPGLDGFNGLFLKKCWGIIKKDFYKLCQDFFDCNINLDCLNESFITLVPKKNNPETVNDFRPISLLNSSIKLLTKILAERL